jgi:hypothetical protein
LSPGELAYLARVLATSGQRRHALRWVRSRRDDFFLATPSPWLTFDAIERVTARMIRGMRIFEWGSGGSTLFWLRWAAQLCSIEHDPGWYDVVKRALPPGAPVDYRLVPPDLGGSPAADASDPLAYASGDARCREGSFRRYATQIDEFPDAHFDLVLVDGRARPSCLHHAAPKVRRGGLLVLDNADRDYYVRALGERLGEFRREAFPGVGPRDPLMWRTDLYTRT